MSIWIVQKQMIMIFAMILIGVYLYKSKQLSDETSKQLSWIIVNVTNPVTLLVAALSDREKLGAGEVGLAFMAFILMYVILIAAAYLLPVLLKVESDGRYAYRMLTIFSNVGFIGIPFASAVLGPKSLIFVSICGLVYNVIIYTYGIASLKAVSLRQHPGDLQDSSSGTVSGGGRLKGGSSNAATSGKVTSGNTTSGSGFSLRSMFNSGMILSVLTIVVYLADIKVPGMVNTTLTYIANCTTFLSMIVLGTSVAQMVPKEVFTKWRLYVFLVLRQILLPVALIFVMKLFIINDLMLRSIVIMSAMPAGNLPLMMAKQYGVKEDVISAGIILTTVATIVTIPAVMFFL